MLLRFRESVFTKEQWHMTKAFVLEPAMGYF